MWEKLINFDQKIVLSLNQIPNANNFWRILIKIFSEYTMYFSVLIIIILWFWQASARKVALRCFFSGMLAWLVFSNIVGHLIFRPRPFEVGGIREIFFHRPTYSFPSDHAAALVAVAFSLWLSGYKKLAIFFFVLVVVMSFARMAAGLHWPSDILGGLVIGIFSAWLVWLFDRPMDYLYNFIIKAFQRLKLA